MNRAFRSMVPLKGSNSPLPKCARGILLCLVMILGLALTSHTFMLLSPIHPTAGAAVSGRYFDNIVIVAMENRNYADVMGDGHGSPDAPYIGSLLPQGSTVPNYHGEYSGCSEACYIALISGDTYGSSNGVRDIGNANTRTLVNLFEAVSVTWHAYCEESCGRNGDHFPWIDFTSIVTSPERMSHVTESGASTSDLVNAVGSTSPANVLWFTPEDSNNMHDNSVSSGDSYLSGFIPNILSKPIFTSGRALLLLWWDEYDPAPFLMIGPTVQQSYISSRNDIEHYTVTKLIEENWGTSSLTSNDASQASMSEFFGTSPPPPGPPTNPPANQPPLLPTQVSDLWLILVGVILGGAAGVAIFGVKSRHKNQLKPTIQGESEADVAPQKSSRKGSARRTKSRSTHSTSRGKLVIVLFYATLLMGGALGASLRTPDANAAVSGRYFDNIVFVAMENQNYADVMGDGTGSSNAPYIASLLSQGATALNYHGNSICGSGSENTYLQLTSAQDWGCPGNGARDIGTSSTKTLVDLFEGARITWQAFCEGSCGRDGDHFPWIDYVSITSSSERMSHIDTSASTTQLVNAMGTANFLWFTPEDSNNMHDNSVSSGDSYLQGFVPQILSKPGFASNGRTLLMLWWDEYNPAPFLIVGPSVIHGLISGRNDLQEYTITKLIEENWALPSLTFNDASQPSMSEFFGGIPPPPPPPGQLSASFTSSPPSPLVGQAVTFTGSATGGTPGYSFSWTFGDGASGTGQVATHAYSAANTYQVTLTARDSVGGTHTTTQSITVFNQPPPPGVLSADFTYSPSSPLAGQPTTFTGTASGGTPPYNFAWDFGDSSSATGSTVQHSYSSSGIFTVTLTVTDNTSNESTIAIGLDIASRPHEIITSFSFRDPGSNDVSSAITWQVWDGGNLVSTASQASLDPLKSYELRIFYQRHLIVSQDITAQPTIQKTLFMYSHNSANNGYIVFNSTIESIIIDEESNTRLRFTAEGSEGPYTIIIAVPKGPTAVLKNGSDYPYTYDSGERDVMVEAPSLSSWELDFGSSTQPPSLCPICPPIPSTVITNLWLVVVGGMIGLTTSLAVLTHRSHTKLQRARRLYASRAS